MTCSRCGSTDVVRLTVCPGGRDHAGFPLGNEARPLCLPCRVAGDPLGAALGWHGDRLEAWQLEHSRGSRHNIRMWRSDDGASRQALQSPT